MTRLGYATLIAATIAQAMADERRPSGAPPVSWITARAARITSTISICRGQAPAQVPQVTQVQRSSSS